MLIIFFYSSYSFRKIHQLNFISLSFNILKVIFLLYLFPFAFTSCSSSKRFTSEEEYYEDEYDEVEFKADINYVRVLLDEKPVSINFMVQSKVYLLRENDKIAEVNSGNIIEFYNEFEKVIAKIGKKKISGKYFQLISAESKEIKYNDNSYMGSLRVVENKGTVKIINFIDVENYLKGVIAKEMPLGKGNENFEALKAFTICARTYTLMKMNQGNLLYDIFPDTRDQVYGGIAAEHNISNRAVKETEGLILMFDGLPATVYYHSTCGGVNENVENVFPQKPKSYLTSIEDGFNPYCKISPRFEWKEIYTQKQFIEQLYNAKLIDSKNYSNVEVNVASRFASGRVDDLEIIMEGERGREEIHLYGNEIRSKIRTPKKNQLLWSTQFNISMMTNDNIVFKGKGFGHGVGLCQWGAIGQSRLGINFEQILKHYYPGTNLRRVDD